MGQMENMPTAFVTTDIDRRLQGEINVPLMPRPDPSMIDVCLEDEDALFYCDAMKDLPGLSAQLRTPSTAGSKRCIPVLIVDDDEVIRCALAAFCRQIGVPYEIARNGKEALEKITASVRTDKSSSYRLVILDNHMPSINGVEVAEILNTKRININIAVHSSGLTDDDCRRFRAAGCRKFLSKPSAKAELLEACKDAAVL